jgi:hypothetical protein
MGYQSAYITEKTSFSSFLSAVLENFDGWVRRNGEKLEFGRFEHGAISTAGLKTLTLHDLTEDPQLAALGYDDASVYTDAIVTGPDRDWDMEDSYQQHCDDAARERLGEFRIKSYDRRFICTSYQQKQQAQELARYYSIPAGDDSIKVRREKAAGLKPGDRFVFNYSPSALEQVYRITSRSDAATGGETELSIQLERCLAPLAYVAPADPTPNRPTPPIPVAATNTRLLQVPALWADGPAPKLLPLVVRPSANCIGFRLYYSLSGTSYDYLTNSRSFALGGTLAAAIGTTASTITCALSGFEISILTDRSDSERLNNTLLLVVDYEVMSIGAVTALGGGQYSLAVLRGRSGSSPASHSASASVFVIERESCELVDHAEFPRTPSIRYFKVAPYTLQQGLELSDATALTFTFSDTSVSAPSSFASVAVTQAASLSWDNPTDPDLEYAEIHVVANGSGTPSVDAIPAATFPVIPGGASVYLHSGMTAGTQRDIYIRLVDSGSYKSAFVGPQSVTPLSASSGSDAVNAELSLSAISLPADKDGNVTSFVGAVSELVILKGISNDSANWAVTKNDTGCTSTLSTRTATVTAMSADVAYVDFTATRTGYATITKRFTITKSKAGTDGTDGVNGEDGIFREFVWRRAASQPTAPSGNGIPSGWYDDPPTGTDPLWMSVAKQQLDGILIDAWSTPVRHDGPKGDTGNSGADGTTAVVTSAPLSSDWSSALTRSQAAGGGAWSDTRPVYMQAVFYRGSTQLAVHQFPCYFSAGLWTVVGGYENPENSTSYTVEGNGTLACTVIVTHTASGAKGVFSLLSVVGGANGESTEVQYSSDATNWHGTWAAGDIYMRHRVGTGTWSASIKFVGTDGTTGTRGSKEFQVDTGTTQTWSDTAADSVITSSGFVKVLLDRVTQYSTTGNKWTETRYWSGSAWVAVVQIVNGSLLVKGSIGTDELAASSVTAVKVGANLVITQAANIGTEIVDTSHIKSLAAGKVATGYMQAQYLSKASKIYVAAYPSRLFGTIEAQGTYNNSMTWPVTTSFSDSAWNHCTPAIMVGPGNADNASYPIASPNDSGELNLIFYAKISGYTGAICIYYRKNLTGSFLPLAAESSDDAGNAKIHGIPITIYGASQTDKWEFLVGPCDANGVVATAVVNKYYLLSVKSQNW